MTDVVVPPLGESVSEATVATWLRKPGDEVAVDDLLVELETDKATLEVQNAKPRNARRSAPRQDTMTEMAAARRKNAASTMRDTSRRIIASTWSARDPT